MEPNDSNEVVELPPHLQLELHNFEQGLPAMGREELMLIAASVFESLLYFHHIHGSRKRTRKPRNGHRRRIAIYVHRSTTSPLVPKPIIDFQMQFSCLREQRRIELLVLERLRAIGAADCLLESTAKKAEWLESALNQILVKAVKWSYEHGYTFHSEPGGTRFWVESRLAADGKPPLASSAKGGVA